MTGNGIRYPSTSFILNPSPPSFLKDACYVGLGGNFSQSLQAIKDSLKAISQLPGVNSVESSHLYLTSPVSSIAQNSFLNAVCKLQCTWGPFSFLDALVSIEKTLGKTPKPKEAPRLIDLDLLFFYDKEINSKTLILPHPRWHERLFVLAPLCDLIAFPFKEAFEKIMEAIKIDEMQTAEILPIKLPFQKEL